MRTRCPAVSLIPTIFETSGGGVLAIRLLIDEAVERAGLAAVDAFRRKAAALADQEHLGFFLEKFDFIDRAEAAAMAAGAAAVGPERPLREDHGIGRLEDLYGRDGGSGDGRVAVIEAVAFGMAAMPAAEEGEHHPAPAVTAVSCERQRIDRAIGAAVAAFGRDLGEGAEHHVDDAQDGLGIAADRLRRGDIEERRRGNDEGDGIEHAGIGGHVAEEMLQRDIAARHRRRIGDIDRPGAGRRGAREIERHLLARDGEIERDLERPILDAVIVEPILGVPTAVRQLAQIGPHLLRRALAKLGEGRGDNVVAGFVEELMEPPRAQLERVDLAVEVAIGAEGLTAVRLDDREDVAAELALGKELHRRDQHRLLIALGRHRIVVAGNVAADIVIMPDRGEVAVRAGRRGRTAAPA